MNDVLENCVRKTLFSLQNSEVLSENFLTADGTAYMQTRILRVPAQSLGDGARPFPGNPIKNLLQLEDRYFKYMKHSITRSQQATQTVPAIFGLKWNTL